MNELKDDNAQKDKGRKSGEPEESGHLTPVKKKKVAGGAACGNRCGMRDNRIDRMERAGCGACAAACKAGSRRCANAVRIVQPPAHLQRPLSRRCSLP